MRLKQFAELKKQHPDRILLFCSADGDFWEAFAEDAEIVAKVIGRIVIHRDTLAMIGLPKAGLEANLKKLLSAGYRVAVCEQVSHRDVGPASVERFVTDNEPKEQPPCFERFSRP